MCAEALTDLDTLTARSHHLDQLARRTLGVVAGLATPRNAKSTPIVPRSAPVPLGDRCDTSPWWAEGEERRGAPLRYRGRRCTPPRVPTYRASHFLRLFKGQKNAKSVSNAPRSAPVPLAERCDDGGWGQSRGSESWRGAARSAAAYPSRSLPHKRNLRAPMRHVLRFARATAGTPLPMRAWAQPCLDLFCATQEPTHDLKRLFHDESGSEATYRRPASEDCPEIASLLVAFRRPASSFPPPLTEAMTYISDSVTLFEPPAPLTTPSILVSTDFNIPQPLGAEITSRMGIASMRYRPLVPLLLVLTLPPTA
ncbi:hypothetical protein EV121DRAFT_274707 [Schizophyllum commune]